MTHQRACSYIIFLISLCFVTFLGYRGANERTGRGESLDAREEHELQEAIRRSLDETSFSTYGSQMHGQSRYPPYPNYGWNIPDIDPQGSLLRDRFPSHSEPRTRDTNEPYPPISAYTFRHRNSPSSPPYPVGDDMPHYPGQQTLYPNLRGSDESSATGREPSAPHPDLFNVE